MPEDDIYFVVFVSKYTDEFDLRDLCVKVLE